MQKAFLVFSLSNLPEEAGITASIITIKECEENGNCVKDLCTGAMKYIDVKAEASKVWIQTWERLSHQIF